MKGKLIVFEGIDGCGKTTQIELLEKYLNNQNIPVKVVSNISDGELGNLLRKSLKDQNIFINDLQIGLLFLSELFIVYDSIKRDLDAGFNVICSRWWYSTLAYIGLNREVFTDIKTIAKRIPEPDYLIYLDIDPNSGYDRIIARNEDREIFENINKLKKTHTLYKFIMEFTVKTNKLILPVDNLSIEQTHKEIIFNLHALLK